MPEAQSDLTLEQCITRVASLRARVEHFERRYAEREDLRGTQVVLRVLALALEDASRRLVKEERDLAALDAEPMSDYYRSIVRSNVRIVNSLERHLKNGLWAISQPHGREFDAFVQPFTRLARSIDDNAVVVYRPTEVLAGYALSRPLAAELLTYVETLDNRVATNIASLPEPLALRYPAHGEQDNLGHLMVGHELAHLALRAPLKPGGRGADYEIFRDVYERIRKENPGDSLPPAEDPPQPGEPLRSLFRQTLGWFTELACDLLAVRMVGPAYFLALNEQLALHPWFYEDVDEYEDTHPAVAWRLTLLGDELDRYFDGLPGVLQDAREKQLFADCLARVRVYQARIPAWEEKITGVRRSIIEQGLARVRENASKILKAAEYKIESGFHRDVSPVWQKLEKDIAPAERIFARTRPGSTEPAGWAPPADGDPPAPWSEPLDWRSILNAGWLYWLATDKDPEDAPLDAGLWQDRRQRRQDMAVMLQGSVELSEIHLRALNVQSELAGFVFDPDR